MTTERKLELLFASSNRRAEVVSVIDFDCKHSKIPRSITNPRRADCADWSFYFYYVARKILEGNN